MNEKGSIFTGTMNLDQYKQKVSADILYEMEKEVHNHDRDYTPSSITEDYWLNDLKFALTPADRKHHPYQVMLRGYGLEIHSEGKWTVVLYFRSGKIIIGDNYIEVDCLERAIEDLRFLCSLIPRYAEKYTDAMNNAALEMQKETIIQEIFEATVAPALSELLKARNLKCKTRRNFKTVTLNLISGKSLVKTFFISYDDFENEMKNIRSYIEQKFPVKKSHPLASFDCV